MSSLDPPQGAEPDVPSPPPYLVWRCGLGYASSRSVDSLRTSLPRLEVCVGVCVLPVYGLSPSPSTAARRGRTEGDHTSFSVKGLASPSVDPRVVDTTSLGTGPVSPLLSEDPDVQVVRRGIAGKVERRGATKVE